MGMEVVGVGVGVGAVVVFIGLAQSVPKLINDQGRFTDSAQTALFLNGPTNGIRFYTTTEVRPMTPKVLHQVIPACAAADHGTLLHTMLRTACRFGAGPGMMNGGVGFRGARN